MMSPVCMDEWDFNKSVSDSLPLVLALRLVVNSRADMDVQNCVGEPCGQNLCPLELEGQHSTQKLQLC